MYFDSRFCIGCNLYINCKLITILYTYRIFYANNSTFLIYINITQGHTLIEEAMSGRAKLAKLEFLLLISLSYSVWCECVVCKGKKYIYDNILIIIKIYHRIQGSISVYV